MSGARREERRHRSEQPQRSNPFQEHTPGNQVGYVLAFFFGLHDDSRIETPLRTHEIKFRRDPDLPVLSTQPQQ